MIKCAYDTTISAFTNLWQWVLAAHHGRSPRLPPYRPVCTACPVSHGKQVAGDAKPGMPLGFRLFICSYMWYVEPLKNEDAIKAYKVVTK